jgi:hypothetical protein
MRRNAGISGIVLMIIAVACGGCATSNSESPSLGNVGAPVALSASPRTLTWKKPVPKVAPHPKPKPTATTTPGETAQQLLSTAVAPLVTADNDHVAVAVYDESTGQFASYGGTREFITASIVKADILSTRLYQQQQQGSDLSHGEQQLAVKMIENSDNNAATALYNDDGQASGIDAANQVFGLTETTIGTDEYWGLTTTTVDDQIRLLKQIFTTSSALSTASRAYIQDLMGEVETDQQWGVPAAADSGTWFAVKNGWLPDPSTGLWEVNSIGDITHDGQHMLIAVLSTDNASYSSGISEVEDVVEKAADAVEEAK